MKQLIIGQIPDNFNPEFYIPIAPYCFINKEEVYPNFYQLKFHEILNSKEELVAFDEKSSNTALYLVGQIAEKYNSEDYNKHSFKFWQSIYYPWLGQFVPFVFRMQLLFNLYHEIYKNDILTVNVYKNDLICKVKDDFGFLKNISNVSFTEWIISKIIISNKPKNWILNYSDKDAPVLLPIKRPTNIKTKLYSLLSSLFFRRFKKVHGFNTFEHLFFSLLTFAKPKTIRWQKKSTIKLNPTIDWKVDIIELIDKAIPIQYKRIQFKKKYSTNGKLFNFTNKLYNDLNSKISAAYAYENNNLVLAAQHGGHNYGSALAFDLNKYIEFDTDYFITWGWKTYKNLPNSKFIPLPSPMLSKWLNRHEGSSKNIILIGTNIKIIHTRFDSSPTAIQWIDYRIKKRKLIEKLFKKGFSTDLYYRPYSENSNNLIDKSYYIKAFPGLKILKGNLHEYMLHSQLIIMDHPGTSWNIAMAMNAPTLLYWKKDWFPFNKEAEIFLERFRKEGVFFETPNELVERLVYLKENYSSIKAWWNTDEIQNLRKEWMAQYAFADKNWRWKWIKTLWSLK